MYHAPTDTACSWLVCHSRGDCANCIHLPWLSGGPATQCFGESSRASPQHGWRSVYSLRETLSPIQDHWTFGCLPREWCLCWSCGRGAWQGCSEVIGLSDPAHSHLHVGGVGRQQQLLYHRHFDFVVLHYYS